MLDYIDNVDKKLLKRIKTIFLKKDGPIIYDPKIEGQQINSDKSQFRIGPWAGPQADVNNIVHEMAHFAEREIDKLKLFPHSSWGFSFGKFWQIGNQSGYEPHTNQSVLREQRVWAYQLSTLRKLNAEIDAKTLVKSVIWLSAWCYYQPFKKDTHKDDIRIDHLAQETEIMSRNEYNYEAFKDAWDKRIEYFNNLKNTEGEIACHE